MDALPHIKAPIYSLMTVLNKEQEVVAATGGDLIASFEEAVEVATGVFCVEIPQRGDVVVSVAKFPMDINLYQAQKAIDNGALAVKDGGTLILVASCREGIGGEEFARLLSSSSSPDDALSTIQGTYKLGYHKAAKMAAVSKRITVMALTDLDDATIRSLFLEPVWRRLNGRSLKPRTGEGTQESMSRGDVFPTAVSPSRESGLPPGRRRGCPVKCPPSI